MDQPMRITMTVIGSTGDVRPLMLLGRELSSRGHEVTLAAFSKFAGMVTDSGLRFFPLSGDAEHFMETIMKPDTNGLTYLPRFEKEIKHIAPQLVQDLTESCRGADLLICNFFGSLNYSLAEKFDIPCVQTYFFPMDPNRDMPISSFRKQNLGSLVNLGTYKAGYLLMGALEKKLLNDWRKENGLRQRKPRTNPDYEIGNHTVLCIYAMSPHLVPRPAEWPASIRMSGFWFDEQPAAYAPPEDLEDFLSAQADPPIYVGFGSMGGKKARKLLTVVLRSLHEAHLRAMVAVGWTGRQLKSNNQVYFADYVPHDWLFPRVKAVIHHGGAGTTAAGLRYGKPTLVIPFAGDQPFWGYHVYQAGCGPKPVSCQNVTVRRLTSAMIDLTTKPRYREKAEALGALIRMENGTRTAADLIEQYTKNGIAPR